MLSLLFFHFRVGVRVAIRASPPLFCGILAAVMFQDPPGAFVAEMARQTFAIHWAPGAVLPVAAIAFLLPAWARPRVSEGLMGWIRHLPVSDAAHRRGLILAFFSVQLPLIIMLGLLAWTAYRVKLPVALPAARWFLIVLAGAFAGLPVRRRGLVVPLSLVAAALAFHDAGQYSLFALVPFVVIDRVAGPIHGVRKSTNWRDSGVFLNWQIARRALGIRIFPAFLIGALAIGASALFITNNHLQGSVSSAAARLGGAIGCAFCLSTLSKHLAIRRPPWPLARSFPWSSTQRIASDGLFVGICALPLLVFVVAESVAAAALVLAVLPLMSVRAAEYIRRIPENKSATLALFGEGAFIAIVLALIPWTALLWLAATIPALYSAREFEKSRKSTVWVELHHDTAGDTASWSN